MTTTMKTVVGSDGSPRCCRRWSVPEGLTVRARLFIFHGTHEHSGRYHDLAVEYGHHGLECFAIDFRGHGQSSGARGDVGSLDDAVKDAISLVVSAPREPSLPMVILGHSLGSMLAFITAHELATNSALPTPDVVVLSGFAMDSVSPPFGVAALTPVLRTVPSVVRAVTAILTKANPVGPACPLPPPEALTHSREEATRVRADPLHVHGWVVNRTGLCLLDARARCHALLPVWGGRFPFLLVHGGDDSLCPRSACDALIAASPQPDKELKVFDGLYHEVLHEESASRQEVLSYILGWMLPRIDARAQPARSRL